MTSKISIKPLEYEGLVLAGTASFNFNNNNNNQGADKVAILLVESLAAFLPS